MRALLISTLSAALLITLAACSPGEKAAKSSAVEEGAKKQEPSLELAQELVNNTSNGMMKAEKIFEGPDGLHGIVVSAVNQSGPKQIVWTSENMEILLPAIAFDNKGQQINQKFLDEQKVYLSASELGDELKDKGFIVGKSGPLVTAFMDPNCGYCKQLYKALKKEIDAGRVRVRFIMVGFLDPSSITRSALILGAKDPAKALHQDEVNSGKSRRGAKEPAAEMEQKVRENTELMGRAGVIATPAIFSCEEGSETPTYATGMPQDIKGFISRLAKDPAHPACK